MSSHGNGSDTIWAYRRSGQFHELRARFCAEIMKGYRTYSFNACGKKHLSLEHLFCVVRIKAVFNATAVFAKMAGPSVGFGKHVAS